MYRIELSPGEETAFRSIEELAVAIRRKVVTSRARIYHNATGKWLPIQFHPHYQQALSMPLTQADLVAGPPVTPLSALKLADASSRTATNVPTSAARDAETQAAMSAWPEPRPDTPSAKPAAPPALREVAPKPVVAPKPIVPPRQPAVPREPEPAGPAIVLGTPAPEPRRVVEPLRSSEPRRSGETRFVEPTRHDEPARTKSSRRRKKPSRSLRVALAGAVLIAGAHLVVSAASGPSTEVAERPRTPRRLIETPAAALKDVSPRTVAAVLPVLQSIPVPKLNPVSTPAAKPAPRAAQPKPSKPAPQPEPIDSTPAEIPEPEIQPAPDPAEITGVTLPKNAPLAPQLTDSAGKRALKGILRSIGGPTPAEGQRAKP